MAPAPMRSSDVSSGAKQDDQRELLRFAFGHGNVSAGLCFCSAGGRGSDRARPASGGTGGNGVASTAVVLFLFALPVFLGDKGVVLILGFVPEAAAEEERHDGDGDDDGGNDQQQPEQQHLAQRDFEEACQGQRCRRPEP